MICAFRKGGRYDTICCFAPWPRTPGAAEKGPALLIRLMINLAVPVLAYVLLRPHVHSDITALVIGAAVPTAYSAAFCCGVAAWTRLASSPSCAS